MQNTLLYFSTVLIWGSTWIVLNFQKGSVAPEASVFYRFALASGLLLAWCCLRKRCLKFSLQDHLFLAAQGLFLFGINYILCYWATAYIPSGLNAISFSMVLVGNIISSALIYKTPIRPVVAIGATLGIVGVVAIFWPSLVALDLSSESVTGLSLSLLGGCSASIGNMLSIRNQKHQIPVTQANAVAMGYGATFTFSYILLSGIPLNFDLSWSYLSAYVYLTIFGTIVAFGCYLTLLGRVGASKATYALVLTPIVALIISTIFENFVWTDNVILGVALILSGNVLILLKKEKPKESSEPVNQNSPIPTQKAA